MLAQGGSPTHSPLSAGNLLSPVWPQGHKNPLLTLLLHLLWSLRETPACPLTLHFPRRLYHPSPP